MEQPVINTKMQEKSETSDAELMATFAQTRSDVAFTSLVERHAGWVYATAYRQLRDPHLAEDATQAVFILLCRRANQMKKEQSQKLSGWLFLTARYTAQSILRSRRRSQHHEKLAASQRPDVAIDTAPLDADLDAAVARLSESDRDAILWRFYRGLEFAAIAQRLGISEEAARKRVSRAVGQLRRHLGVTASVEGLTVAAMVGTHANIASLSANVSQVAMTAAAGGAVPAGVASAVKGAIYIMAAAKIKIAAIVTIVVLLMATGASVVVWQIASSAPEPPPVAMNPVAVPNVVPDAPTTETFEQIYALRADDVIRRLQPPFPDVRLTYYKKSRPSQAQAVPQGPNGMMIVWHNNKPELSGMIFTSKNGGYDGLDLIQSLLNVYSQDVEGDLDLLNKPLPGDFIVDGKATAEQFRIALAKLLSEAAGTQVTLIFRQVDRPMIAFKGKWQINPLPGAPPKRKFRNMQSIEIYGKSLNKEMNLGGGGSGDEKGLAGWLGRWIGKAVVFDAPSVTSRLSWHQNDAYDVSEQDRKLAHDATLVCNHIAEQTGLTWDEETRPVTRLFVERQK